MGGGDGCTTVYLMPLKHTLINVFEGRFCYVYFTTILENIVMSFNCILKTAPVTTHLKGEETESLRCGVTCSESHSWEETRPGAINPSAFHCNTQLLFLLLLDLLPKGGQVPFHHCRGSHLSTSECPGEAIGAYVLRSSPGEGGAGTLNFLTEFGQNQQHIGCELVVPRTSRVGLGCAAGKVG